MAMEVMKRNCIHYWVIDCNDVGVCRCCGEVKDFRKLQRRERDSEGLYRRESRKGTGKATRRGRPRKDEGLL